MMEANLSANAAMFGGWRMYIVQVIMPLGAIPRKRARYSKQKEKGRRAIANGYSRPHLYSPLDIILAMSA